MKQIPLSSEEMTSLQRLANQFQPLLALSQDEGRLPMGTKLQVHLVDNLKKGHYWVNVSGSIIHVQIRREELSLFVDTDLEDYFAEIEHVYYATTGNEDCPSFH